MGRALVHRGPDDDGLSIWPATDHHAFAGFVHRRLSIIDLSPAGHQPMHTPDGRFTIVMPHPERVFRTIQMSWRDPSLGEDSPWMRMFRNARKWVG